MNLRLDPVLLRRGAVAIAIIVAALAVDRLTHLPLAAPLFDRRTWTVPVGHRLEFAGVRGPELMQVETAAGDGVRLSAERVRLDGGPAARTLDWVVSRLDAGPGDGKVHVEIAAAAPGRAARFAVRRSGATTRPELLIDGADVPLLVRAGLVFGDDRTLPPTALLVDGRPAAQSLAFSFVILPGGSLSLTFPTYADGTPKGLTVDLGTEERMGPRLWLRQAGIVADDTTRPRLAACAAPPGAQLWPVLLRTSAAIEARDCTADRMLAATALDIGKDTLTLSLAGSAYLVDADQPTTARWWQWIRDNPILGSLVGLAFTALVGAMWRGLGGRAR